MEPKTVQDLERELKDLKAAGYDTAAQLENLGQRMREINQAIMAKNQEINEKKKSGQ